MSADGRGRLLVDPAAAPVVLQPLLRATEGLDAGAITRLPPPTGDIRKSAVLVLLAGRDEADAPDGADGLDVLLIERAHTLRHHPGQPAFPGGEQDAVDDGPVATALREAAEEVGLRPETVAPLALLPSLWVPPSGFVVVPVLAYWVTPHPVGVADPREVASVHRVPLADLRDPRRRCTVTHPSGWRGPAFEVAGLLVWGFTAGLLDRLLALGGLDRDWDADRVCPLPETPGLPRVSA